MNEILLKKMIRMKLDLGVRFLEFMPSPIEKTGKMAMRILQEELQACLDGTEQNKHQAVNITKIPIDS